jgi:heme exporter protein D
MTPLESAAIAATAMSLAGLVMYVSEHRAYRRAVARERARRAWVARIQRGQ